MSLDASEETPGEAQIDKADKWEGKSKGRGGAGGVG